MTDLANIPNESGRADSLDRLLHRVNCDVPSSVCLRRTVTCSTQGGALRGGGMPHAGMDHAAAEGGVSLGPGASICAARS